MSVRRDWNKASADDWADVLAGIALFEGIGKRDLRRIARAAEFAEFAPGDHVVSTGDPSTSFYVILSGGANVTAKPAARPLKTGDYFGEIGLLGDAPRSATVVAASDLHVMRLPRRAFLELVERHPSLARRFASDLGTRVRELEHQAAQPPF
jgi:CRP-like cAMP-binding protein